MADSWQRHAQHQGLAEFASLEAVFALQGQRVSIGPFSEVIRVELDGQAYYVKRYWRGGKGLRRWLGRSRVEAECANLRLFSLWQIPTPTLVAWGAQHRLGLFRRGALVSLAIAESTDMATLAQRQHPLLQDRLWIQGVCSQIAHYTRILHQHHFTHNDLKWRNLLVDAHGQVYFFDCPCGGFWRGWLLDYRIVKDLACLDKVARHTLSRSQRLRFYLQYLGRERLQQGDKWQLLRILYFFDGRE